jgi:hypothetical protein
VPAEQPARLSLLNKASLLLLLLLLLFRLLFSQLLLQSEISLDSSFHEGLYYGPCNSKNSIMKLMPGNF